ncbi:MAG: hypothetical protein DRQ60_02965 [Gammaproteobacteria bacterium]|nr:MAG: hypothetical protein DRQ60_02965 [Gammaproteobacteria bacterium]
MRTFQVELRHSEQSAVQFGCRSDQRILDAAYCAGYLLASTCLRGGCGACRAKVIVGKISELAPMSNTHCQDPVSGKITHRLLCVAAPATDVIIEMDRPWRTRSKNPLSSRLPGRLPG